MENKHCLSNKFQAKESKAHNQKLEIRKLQDQLKQASKKAQIAVRRLEGIRDQAEEKAKNQEAKLQLRQEIEKGLHAEQQVFDMKDEMEFLRKEIALVIGDPLNSDCGESIVSQLRPPPYSELCVSEVWQQQ
jgi:hypothetical protein